MIYIVVGPGRTGSNLICQHISSNDMARPGGICKAIRANTDELSHIDYMFKRETGAENFVIHTHDAKFPEKLIEHFKLDPNNITLIISKRYNKFELGMSHAVTFITDEWHDYTNKEVAPRKFAIDTFVGGYHHYQRWYNDLNTIIPYNKIAVLYYEDFNQNDYYIGSKHIAAVLGIDPEPFDYRIPTPKSPYDYKKLIPNWEELYQEYVTLENKKDS